MTSLAVRHAWLAKMSRQSTFIPSAQEHQGRCVCGFMTTWTTSLQRADEELAWHIAKPALALSPASVELRRRLDAFAIELAERQACEMEPEPTLARSDNILVLAIVSLIAAFVFAAAWLSK